MRRGEVWRYEPKGSPRDRLVVLLSAAGVLDSTRPYLLGISLAEADPGDILAVPVAVDDQRLWADPGNLHRIYRPWLVEHIATLQDADLDRVVTNVRAALDLDP